MSISFTFEDVEVRFDGRDWLASGECDIDGSPVRAEPDVGIMSDWIEDVHVTTFPFDVTLMDVAEEVENRVVSIASHDHPLWKEIEKACENRMDEELCEHFDVDPDYDAWED